MWELSLSLALSAHLGLAGDYNEIHPNIRLTNDNFIVGAYYNSEESISPYAGLRFDYKQGHLEAGLVGGYGAARVLPYFKVGYDINETSGIFIAPAYERIEKERFGVVVGVEFKLGKGKKDD